ncbi:MAG TPA: ABC transporter permease [Bacillota bacterium]|nr:ABC transporter permease [Bacillota bacterium]HOR85783.1 ABC transporter permease [Bacillota bacterium]HPL53244.1 ABC transporter permease [Bacillota bacterium]
MNINPVLLKELKVRMRGWKAAGIIAAYLLILSLVALFIMYNAFMNPYSSTIDPQVSIGAYTGLAIIQFILIMFIVPALTAGAISGEREKQTLDLVLCTRLRPISIITGKLFASTSQTLLLIIASLPLFSMVFMFGGISIKEILQLFGFYIVTAVAVGCIGIFYSACLRRTTAATVLTYGTVAFLAFGTIFIGVFYVDILYKANYKDFLPIFYANPIVGFSSLLAGQFGYYRGGMGILPGLFLSGNTAKSIDPWLGNVIFDIVFSAVLLVLSAIRINPVRRGIFSFFTLRKRAKKA